ncbi:conserved exported hypothetical protein [Kamptonema sp. PCC 6506]|nr:hypothetical protein [Kamptonema formosum]CBN58787.1 conserved exported hypothetical protein [Kamptonema sp. PCC 6506]
MNSNNKYLHQIRSIFSITLFVALVLGVSYLTVNFFIRIVEKFA